MYLDDGWGTDSPMLCQNISNQVQKDFSRAGLIVNEDKSILLPVPILEWLSNVWNLKVRSVEVKSEKICKLKRTVTDILSIKSCSARDLAKIVGSIISLSFCF
jgi:hypothetical protein